MTNPFTNYAFATADAGTVGHERKLPDRLSDIHNVKDFGATGAGFPTDDWAAIMACYNWQTYFITASASNLVASFTGAVSSATFTGVISGSTLTVSSVTGTVAIGQAIGGTSLILVAGGTTITAGSGTTWTVNGPLQSVGPIGMGTPTATFTGTITNNGVTNTLTVSGVSGTISIGQTVYDGLIPGTTITGGSGTTWTVSLSHSVASQAMATDLILTATSVTSGTITVGDYLINNGGTDASPSTIAFGTYIVSSKGGGIYTLPFFNDPTTGSTPVLQNFSSQPMMTVSTTLHLSTPVASTLGQGIYDADNATVVGDGYSANGGIPLVTSSSTITINTGVGGLVSIGHHLGFQYSSRGAIYFPPGNYYVSRPIDFTAGGPSVIWLGEMGTTLTGNFTGYVLTQSGLPSGAASGLPYIERFNVVNLHAAGGGIRLGGALVGSIHDCTITANKGISDYNNDMRQVGAYFGSFEISIENCSMNAGSNYSGSFGLAMQSDGPVTNCRIIGYEHGFLTAGGEGCQVLLGCYFEKCGTGVSFNLAPDGGSYTSSGVVVSGCWFKNCSVGIEAASSTSLATIIGTRIEGTNGQAHGGTDPQYGIKSGNLTGLQGSLSQSMIAGVTVVGQFAQAGIHMSGFPFNNIYGPNLIGVSDSATSPHPFDLDTSNSNIYIATQIACSARHIYTFATMPANSINAGDQINVSDGTNGLNWGDPLTGSGTHTTHYAAQWNGSAWTVVGK